MQSEKTSVMTIPKCPGAQIWQIYPWICQQIYHPLVLTSHGQKWQLADLPLDLLADLSPSADILWSRMAIGRSTPRSASRSTLQVLTSSGQEWQFHIATVTADIGRSTGRSTPLNTDI